MSYPLHLPCFEQFKKWRKDCHKDKVRDSKGRVIKPLTKLAEKRLEGFMRRYDPRVQRGMVAKSMDNYWSNLYAPKNTLLFDDPQTIQLRSDEVTFQSDEMRNVVGKITESLKPPEKKFVDVDGERKKISNILDQMRKHDSDKKGSDLDPFWQEQMKYGKRN